MARHENVVTVNSAIGATLKEVPGFVLDEWGPKLKKFSNSCFDLSVGLQVIKTLRLENHIKMSEIDSRTHIPADSLAFFSGKGHDIEVEFSPKMDEVIINQTVQAGRKNSKLEKAMYIRMDYNGFIKDATFIESFRAPNFDLATRVVKVNYDLRGTIDKVIDTRTINSKMDYLASGLPPLPNSLSLSDGRSSENRITYVWDRMRGGPFIDGVEETETSQRSNFVINFDQSDVETAIDDHVRNRRHIGIDSVKYEATETFPYGYLSKMLPPDLSIGKLVQKKT
ncbi:MAG: hypothetical protein AAB437_00680 [Patescibacteria group bacterium]